MTSDLLLVKHYIASHKSHIHSRKCNPVSQYVILSGEVQLSLKLFIPLPNLDVK